MGNTFGCAPSKQDGQGAGPDQTLTGVSADGSNAPLLGNDPSGKLQDFTLKDDATPEVQARADIVISIPVKDDPNILAGLTATLGVQVDETAVNPLVIKRDDMLKRISRAGLVAHSMLSADKDEWFIIIDATEERLMEAAESTKFEMRLKKSWQVPYAKFTIARKDDFVWENRANGKVFSTRDRQTLIMYILEKESYGSVEEMVVSAHDNMIWKQKYGRNKLPTCGFNLDDYLSEGVIDGYWAMHGHGRRFELVENWAQITTAFFKPQPLKMIFEYFNSKTALYFAFVGYYSAWLAFSAIFGIGVEAYDQMRSAVHKDGAAKSDDNELMVFYAFFMALWGTLFLEFWKRYNSELAYRWSTIDLALEASERSEFSNGTDGLKRQGFYAQNGAFVPYDEDVDWKPGCCSCSCGMMFNDDVDEDVDEETKAMIMQLHPSDVAYMDPQTQTRRMCINCGVALLFTGTVIAALMAFLVMRLVFQASIDAQYGAMLASTLQALVTVGLNVVYKELAIIMVNYENHRTDDEWENAIVNKVFGFQFINSYFTLFYIAFLKGKIGNLGFPWESETYSDQCKDATGHPTDNCMLELNTLLLSTLLTTQIASTIAEAALPLVQYQLLLRAEQAKWVAEGNEGELKLSDIDHESKLVPAYALDAFNDYNKMAIQFGYVSMFVAAFPLAPLCALANNMLEIRTDAYKRLLGMQRPAPSERAEDIGAWLNILELMSLAAVATNVGVLCFTSNKLTNDFKLTPEQRVWTFVILEHIVVCVKLFFAGAINDRPDWVVKRLAKDEYMLHARDEVIEKEEMDAIKAEEDLKKIGGVTLETDGAKAPMSSTR